MEELVKALTKAQSEFPKIPKDKIAKIRTKTGFEYSYKYADLATVISHVNKQLTANGLAVTHTHKIEGADIIVITTLRHVSGEFIESAYPVPRDTSPQERGSHFTYARRYNLCGLLNIAGDEDDDAQIAEAKRKEDVSNKANESTHTQRATNGNGMDSSNRTSVPEKPTQQTGDYTIPRRADKEIEVDEIGEKILTGGLFGGVKIKNAWLINRSKSINYAQTIMDYINKGQKPVELQLLFVEYGMKKGYIPEIADA